MWKYLELIYMNLKMSLMKQMFYKANFIMRLVADTAYLVIYYIFFELLFDQIPVINSWQKEEVFVIMGTFHMINSLFLGVFFSNVVQIPHLIKTGKFDDYLLMPVKIKFIMSTVNMDISSLINFIFGLNIVIISIHSLNINTSLFVIFRYILFVLLGTYTHYNIFFLIMISAFWIGDSTWGISFFMKFNSFADKPISLFRGAISRLITFIIPIGLVANTPASILLDKGQESLSLVMVIISILIFIVTRYFLSRGLRYYESSGTNILGG